MIADTPLTAKAVVLDPDPDDDIFILGAESFSPCCSTDSSLSSTLAPLSPAHTPLQCEAEEQVGSQDQAVIEDGYFLHSRLTLDAPSFYWDMASDPILSLRNTIPWDEPFALRIKNNDLIGAPTFHFRFGKTLEYPWDLQAVAPNGEDCSIHDAFSGIYRNLNKLASKEAALQQPIERRRLIYHARLKRCKDMGLDPTKEPLRRIDFLCDGRRFFGVSTASMPTGWFLIQAGTVNGEEFAQ